MGFHRPWIGIRRMARHDFSDARATELWDAGQADAINRGNVNWPGVPTKYQDKP